MVEEYEENKENIVDARTYTDMISACVKCGKWEVAVSVFDCMRRRGGKISPDVVAYNAAMNAYANSGIPEKSINLFVDMVSSKVKPDVVSFNTVIAACIGGQEHLNMALEVFQAMRDVRVHPNTRTYNTVLQAANNQPETSRRIWQSMVDEEVSRDQITYAHAFQASVPKDWKDSNRMIEDMISRSIQPDTITINSELSYLSRHGYWEAALARVRWVESEQVEAKLDSYSLHALVSAFEAHLGDYPTKTKARMGKEAVTLFNRLLGRGVLIGAEAAASLMALLHKCGDETSEDDLLRSVTEGITPARRTAYVRDLYTTLIEKDMPWDYLISILHRMEKLGLNLTDRALRSILRDLETPVPWKSALEVLQLTQAVSGGLEYPFGPANFTRILRRIIIRGSDGIGFLEGLRNMGGRYTPDVTLYRACISACKPPTTRQKAIRAYYELNRENFETVLDYEKRWIRGNTDDPPHPSSALSNQGSGSLLRGVLQEDVMAFESLSPDSQILQYARVLDWQNSLKIIHSTPKLRQSTLNRALYVFAKQRKWMQAARLVQRMQRDGQANSESFGCLIAAYDLSGEHEKALSSFRQIQDQAIVKTPLMYCCAIRSMEMLGRRRKALELFSEMGHKSLRR
ncbi:hypothetical protein AAMO2058_000981200 [Amorphochlora amoebiformis]|uniref:Pentacotripeptide-repeat region of PRORP domain-containing protein n=1 Tax=Amorphochlora amoebiformis TaxID=1561963 RepID=A0A6T6SDA8_9EUKA|mmetsp:Transcript_13623/g.21525  ORF Transcript_13623/g.21525 Transcript_13623/m.21525 type:complete len:630 (+) Transcript_13623:399-2288(+)